MSRDIFHSLGPIILAAIGGAWSFWAFTGGARHLAQDVIACGRIERSDGGVTTLTFDPEIFLGADAPVVIRIGDRP